MTLRHWGPCALVLAASSLAATLHAEEATETEPSQVDTKATKPQPRVAHPSRPAYQLLRQNENWSALAHREPSDFYDPIKYVPLNQSRSVWVSFGGHVWARSET